MAKDLPYDVYIKIFEKFRNESFRIIGGIMTVSSTAKAAMEGSKILKDADIREFVEHPSMVFKTSPYRSIFVKCMEAGNTTAILLEGIRIAYKDGDIFEALKMVEKGDMLSCASTQYTAAMFRIMAGDYEQGWNLLWPKINWEDEEFMVWQNEVADEIIQVIKGMDPPKEQTFCRTYRCPQLKCDCEWDEKKSCIVCFIWYHSIRMVAYS